MSKEMKTIKMDLIMFDQEFNSRDEISPTSVVDLAKSIETEGLIQPILVAPMPEGFANPDAKVYLLVAGYRRFMAHKVLQRDEIECVVNSAIETERQALVANMQENLNRKDLNIVEEAKSIARLRDLGVTETQAAKDLNKSRGWIQVRYMLLALPNDIQEEIKAGMITQTQIRELYSIKERYGMKELYEAARTLKDQKILGRKNVSVNPDKMKTSKRHRSRSEIFNMIEHILNSGVGPGLHTKTLSWAAGEIADNELYFAINVYAKENGLDYTMPREALQGI